MPFDLWKYLSLAYGVSHFPSNGTNISGCGIAWKSELLYSEAKSQLLDLGWEREGLP